VTCDVYRQHASAQLCLPCTTNPSAPARCKLEVEDEDKPGVGDRDWGRRAFISSVMVLLNISLEVAGQVSMPENEIQALSADSEQGSQILCHARVRVCNLTLLLCFLHVRV
jgi:hypothetical protein